MRLKDSSRIVDSVRWFGSESERFRSYFCKNFIQNTLNNTTKAVSMWAEVKGGEAFNICVHMCVIFHCWSTCAHICENIISMPTISATTAVLLWSSRICQYWFALKWSTPRIQFISKGNHGLIRHWQRPLHETTLSSSKYMWTFELSRITQSWQCCQLCIRH